MFADIVIPKNNEAEFVEISSKLGFRKICFLYNFDEQPQEKIQKKLDLIRNHKNLEIGHGFIVNQKSLNKASKQSTLLVVKNADKLRFFIESKKIKLIYGFERTYQKDHIHQRASGLNHIICEIARKNNVSIGFPYSQLFEKNNLPLHLIIGRMIQNIRLCQKYKVKSVIGSFSERTLSMRSPHDIMSLFRLLGMHDNKIKESMCFGI